MVKMDIEPSPQPTNPTPTQHQAPKPTTTITKTTKPTTTTRSIRAHFDEETITVYQAYNVTIATAAVADQNLAASPLFNPNRTTWIKPSWSWMMYRSGYAAKDKNQSRILALRMRHEHFALLLSRSRGSGVSRTNTEKGSAVVIQWDPERDVRLRRLHGSTGRTGVRSIQIGIPGGMVPRWTREWIVDVRDVTERARALGDAVGDESVSDEELVRRGLVPEERVYDFMLPPEVRVGLGMDVDGVDQGDGDGGGVGGELEVDG